VEEREGIVRVDEVHYAHRILHSCDVWEALLVRFGRGRTRLGRQKERKSEEEETSLELENWRGSVWVARIEEEEKGFIGREGKREQQQVAWKIPRFFSGVWIPQTSILTFDFCVVT